MSTEPESTWLDRLAHDLRGPLAPLQTASYLLQRDDLDPARRQELLAMLARQAQRLASMVEELEDWTRVGRGRLLGRPERSELAMLLDYAAVGSRLAGTPVAFNGDAGVDAVVAVEGDPQRLTQLLRILLDYAASRGGAPRLALSTSDGRIRIDARMPGPVPDAAATDALLERQQPEPYDEGLGLRLMLARGIARAHGGELTALVDDDALVLRLDLPLAPP
jgi:signal transduction histidine kinase